MVNPASIMKIMNLKNKFAANHPKFVSFINYCLNGGIQEGTVIEITVTKPGEQPVTSNMKVMQSDIDIFQAFHLISYFIYTFFHSCFIQIRFIKHLLGVYIWEI